MTPQEAFWNSYFGLTIGTVIAISIVAILAFGFVAGRKYLGRRDSRQAI